MVQDHLHCGVLKYHVDFSVGGDDAISLISSQGKDDTQAVRYGDSVR